MIHVPLALNQREEVEELRDQILFLLGDKLYQRRGDRYSSLDVEVPEPLASNQCLGRAPQTESATFGSVISFRKDGAFAMLSFREDQTGFGYRLGSMAGWHKYGNEEQLRTYWTAFDTLLDDLGVLAESYKYSCPCGHEEVISGGHSAIRAHISSHLGDDHTENRIPNSVLVGQDISQCGDATVPEKPSSRTGPPSQSA